MRIVIQCAGRKRDGAPSLRTRDDRPVSFVAHPPPNEDRPGRIFARPDDPSPDGRTWRERLLTYNQAESSNPLGLLRAAHLYRPREYARLERRFGAGNLWILSAGWGLIPAAFLTPTYDITFSSSAASMFRRRKKDVFHDWAMMDLTTSDPLVFLGGKDYLPQFAQLTTGYRGRRIALFNSAVQPKVPDMDFVRYETKRKTNWHYDAANALIDGTVQLLDLKAGK